MDIRPANPADAVTLAELLSAYLAEQFPGHTGTSAARLELDVLSGSSGQRVLLAERATHVIGFVGWHRVYDMHWGKTGAQIADMYVVPARRGLGVAAALVAAVCADAQREGASYLTGGAYDRDSPIGRFYERIAVALDSAECHCSGRAFRRMAELQGQSPKAIARNLPPREWNYEE
ncbi:MAG: GNAT family N-acetyltransferase [Gemmatimonadota bacterium]|nr:GNAT family N-acetyltransferase [Gemmatimonadota bacterium]